MSSLRLIRRFTNGNRMAAVYRDADWNEYRVKFHLDGAHQTEADYHDTDKVGACDTAASWVFPAVAQAEPVTIDVTPTWTALLPVYLTVLRDGNAEGRKAAAAELARMAQAADLHNAAARAAR